MKTETDRFGNEDKTPETLEDVERLKSEAQKKIDVRDATLAGISPRIKELLDTSKLWDYIVKEELNKKHIGDIKAKEVLFLCSLGRKVRNKKTFSFNALVLAPSSSGKDHLTSSVLRLFPDLDYEHYKRISQTALNYLHTIESEPNYTYDGKIIYLEEISEPILNNEVMKGFTSGEQEISSCAITKQKGRGVDLVKIRGHPVVIATTATSIPSEEIRNRFNVIGLDESDEQTENTFTDEELEYDDEIRNFISRLKPCSVIIPKDLFNFIKKVFPKNKLRYRRDFPRFLDYIRVIALFNKNNEEEVVATGEDYNKAKEIFINSFSSPAHIPLKEIDRKIVRILEFEESPLTAKQITNNMEGAIALQNLYPHLRNLAFSDIINEITGRDAFNNVTTTYILSEEYRDKKPFKLPEYVTNNAINGNHGINDENRDKLSNSSEFEIQEIPLETLKELIPLKDNNNYRVLQDIIGLPLLDGTVLQAKEGEVIKLPADIAEILLSDKKIKKSI